HEHIYHTNATDATLDMAKALSSYKKPVVVLADSGSHALLVAGFWATGDPLTDSQAQIRSFAVFNPWNSWAWGQYITSGLYQKISLYSWLNAPALFGLPYSSNGWLNPDPSIGIYQAGPGTQNPDKHHWIGNFVIVEPDTHAESADFSFDENNGL